MKVLWVNSNFMHPTTKGGQIRTLEMLRHLSRWHEIHYVALADPAHPEGPRRATEYAFAAYPVWRAVPAKTSVAFVAQLAAGMFAATPLAVRRFHSNAMRRLLMNLMSAQHFDRAVVDHLAPTSYFPLLERSLLFQHNVETVIWRRRAEHARDPISRLYFRRQAERMFAYERRVCRVSGQVIAVSPIDARTMESLFGLDRVAEVPTGVDAEYFAPPPSSPPVADLVFVGSMDWLPNVDGVEYFVRAILPMIRHVRPDCSLAIVGRTPPPQIAALARRDPRMVVTGTVADIRPYLWGSSVSIVPLRIGGGTRLKIYESMAANIPVVSTRIGAEGLAVSTPENIRIADDAEEFAAHCLTLLDDRAVGARQAAAARQLVESRCSWREAAQAFDAILTAGPKLM